MLLDKMEQRTNLRFKNVEDFEPYINAIGVDYDSEVVIVTAWLYKLNTTDFKKINRSQYGGGTDFKQDIVQYMGNKCYISTSSNCFTRTITYLTGKEYMNEFLTFTRDEQRRSNVMTSARIQPFSKKHTIFIGCYYEFRVCPRNITETHIALFMYKNHCCLFLKSKVISFNKTIEELKVNFEVVDNVMSAKQVKSFINYDYKPNKVQPQITNMILND